jgi:hypothetical protein
LIKDRLTLGAISGILGSFTKTIIVGGFKRLGLAEFNGTETSAGMLLPAYKVNTPSGKLVGHITNTMIGMTLGIAMTYLLSATGKDKAIIKGAGMSGVFWMILYGNYANMGGSTVRPALPSTILSNLVGHFGYGVVTSFVITRIGDPALFKNEIPITSQQENQAREIAPQHMASEKRYINKIRKRVDDKTHVNQIH